MKSARWGIGILVGILFWLSAEQRVLTHMEKFLRPQLILQGRASEWWLCLAALASLDVAFAFGICFLVLRKRMESTVEYFSLAADWTAFGIMRAAGMALTDTTVTPLLDRVALGKLGWILLGASFAWALIVGSKWGRYGEQSRENSFPSNKAGPHT